MSIIPGLDTIRLVFKVVSISSKVFFAGKALSTVANFIPKEKREKMAKGLVDLKGKSQDKILAFLEEHSPGFVDKVVKRNAPKGATKEDLEQALRQNLDSFIQELNKKDGAANQQKPQKKQPKIKKTVKSR